MITNSMLDQHQVFDTQLQTITPDDALEMLKYNNHNRNARPRHVARLAADMVNERWVDNGDAIRFSRTGRLLDGQHRLLAIIKSGRAVRMRIIRGLPDECQSTIDDGAKRKTCDVLSMHGVQYAHVLPAAIKVVLCWDRHRNPNQRITINNSEILDLYESMPGIGDSVVFGTQLYQETGRGILPSTATACHYILARIDKQDADEFFRLLISGTDLSKGHPCHTLRARLIKSSESKGRADHNLHTALLFKAWNAYRSGRPMPRVKWTEEEVMPEPK